MTSNDENQVPAAPIPTAPSPAQTPAAQIPTDPAPTAQTPTAQIPSTQILSTQIPTDRFPEAQPRAARTPWRRAALLGAVVGATAVLALGASGLSAALVSTALSSGAVSSTIGGLTDGLTDDGPDGGGEVSDELDVTDGTVLPPSWSDRRASPLPRDGAATGETDTTPATGAEQVGVVTIVTTVGYDAGSQGAGTGMVLSADGLVLTNHHVIDGSTSIEVTVESTGDVYGAELVGGDEVNDVAVLQLVDGAGRPASGLDTVEFDQGGTVSVGDPIYSVGNASGTGDLVTAAGVVTATDVSIRVGDGYTGATEDLGGLIELDSDVVSGDSGGPLFDDDGEVVGIVTAASSGAADITGYAIDIDLALDLARQIDAGVESGTVRIGSPAFLGVQLATGAQGGAPVGGVVGGTPAAAAGIDTGAVITAVDGATVTSSDDLGAAIAAHDPGDDVTVDWTDSFGGQHSASVTLAAGPA